MTVHVSKTIKNKELEALAKILKKNSSFTLPQLHGFLTAIVSSPYFISPTDWLEDIFNEPSDSMNSIEAMEKNVEAVLSLLNQIHKDIIEGNLIPLLSLPHSKEWSKEVDLSNLSEWCKGYLHGILFYWEKWEEEETRSDFLRFHLFKITLLVGNVDQDVLFESVKPKDKKSLNKKLQLIKSEIIEIFPHIIESLYVYWSDYAEENQLNEEPLVDEMLRTPQQKMGRNEPCICGSGKKYKKCCLQ